MPDGGDIDQVLMRELKELDAILAATGAGVARNLAPGIPPRQVYQRLSKLGMAPSGELLTWFAWHNGLTTASPSSFGEGCILRWCPLTLDETIDWWRMMPRGGEAWEWIPTWLPLAVNNTSAKLAVDCTPPSSHRAEVRVVLPDEGLFSDEQRPRGHTITDMVGMWSRALTNGWWAYDATHDLWERRDDEALTVAYGISLLV